jgi:hypothetical protein
MVVKDPKRRIILAAPFIDRVVHTAIHQVIAPIIEQHLSAATYACRQKMGNRAAAQTLLAHLQSLGSERFVVKLDIANYFASIPHRQLLERLLPLLPDCSCQQLLVTLLRSHPEHSHSGIGIPIGNLTSQLFANFYLASADQIALTNLGKQGFYIRYMDDMVIGGRNKGVVLDCASAIILQFESELSLRLPCHKRVPLGAALGCLFSGMYSITLDTDC